jgi:hypothetical protein
VYWVESPSLETSHSPAIGSHAGSPFSKLSKKYTRSLSGMFPAHGGIAGSVAVASPG